MASIEDERYRNIPMPQGLTPAGDHCHVRVENPRVEVLGGHQSIVKKALTLKQSANRVNNTRTSGSVSSLDHRYDLEVPLAQVQVSATQSTLTNPSQDSQPTSRAALTEGRIVNHRLQIARVNLGRVAAYGEAETGEPAITLWPGDNSSRPCYASDLGLTGDCSLLYPASTSEQSAAGVSEASGF